MNRFRVAYAAVAAAVLSLSATTVATAQDTSAAGRFALRITSGAFVPTGSQRGALADAQMTAAQLSWSIRPALAVTGTFGWARSRDLGVTNSPKLDVFTSDLGIEARRTNALARRAAFIGLGAGVRSYDYRKLDVDATNNVAGYAAAGGEVAIWRIGMRVEVRDYVAGYEPLTGTGPTTMRNDVVVMGALRYARNQSTQH